MNNLRNSGPHEMAATVPIIGGGPAGMSCALWLHNYGLAPLIVEREGALGGLVRRNPYPDRSLLGRPVAHAREHAEEFARHVRETGIACRFGAEPARVDREADGSFVLTLAFSDGRPPQSLHSTAIVIATGTDFRGEEWLDRVANARHLAALGRVHVGPTWPGEPGAKAGTHVVIVGGGDNAFDVANFLLSKGVKATVVLRAKAPRAQALLVERVKAGVAAGLARIITQRTVAALDQHVAGVRLRLSDGTELDADHIVLALGYRPNTHAPWLAALALRQDRDGYLIVDANMEASCPGVFAVGDVANPTHPSVATALASGTVAAREIQRRLASGTGQLS
jgi:thioredoxin reductase (NADPH)